ncbi:carbohydrate ABC transporter permease [Marispirochaeta sp.]|uniref:carbohydrate ABC transporter permease n=1 Tax=Marispirochaeta sp. TaxID=2038653 RepID=UPI0029C96EE5|nr:carbohydrate ABC transporter permease [Marispirochaeta sp.]
MLVVSLISVYPLLWVIVQSLKTETEFLTSIWTLPGSLHLSNYKIAWSDADISNYFTNSVVVTLATTIVNIVFVMCASYAFAKLRFPLKNFFFYMIVFNMLIPTAIILLPMFIMVNRMGIVNTLPALVFPYFQGFAPLGLIIGRAYFADLPNELLEAAELDGCGTFTTFLWVMLPLTKPIVATLAILSSMMVWNEYLWALVSLTDKTRYTLSVGVAMFSDQAESVGYTPIFAALSISTIIIVIIYLAMQKQFVRSIAAGAVKG